MVSERELRNIVLLKRFIDSRLMVFIAHIRTRRSDSTCKSLHRSWGHSISWVRVWIILNLYCYKAFFIIIILILLLLRTTFWTHQIFTILHYVIIFQLKSAENGTVMFLLKIYRGKIIWNVFQNAINKTRPNFITFTFKLHCFKEANFGGKKWKLSLILLFIH